MKTFKNFLESSDWNTMMSKDSTFGGQSDKAAQNRKDKKTALYNAEKQRNKQFAELRKKRQEAGKSFRG